jgi:hypothetical protein
VSIVQPLIAPLYGGKSIYELTALLAGQAEATGHEIVQATGRSSIPVRTLTPSGENRCTMAGLTEPLFLRSSFR